MATVIWPGSGTTGQWTLIVPVRNPITGKSRLGLGQAVAEALAMDALAAVGSTRKIRRTIVVTNDGSWTSRLPVFTEVLVQRNSGLNAALDEAVAASGNHRVAIMLGDLPALTSADLTEALRQADTLPRGLVADRCGSGSTLITALEGFRHQPAFGPDSAARHRGLGYVDLEIHPCSTLRYDVDTLEDLHATCRRGIGAHTLLALERCSTLSEFTSEAEAADTHL